MTYRLLVYPLLLVTILPLLVLLRGRSRGRIVPILRHAVVLIAGIMALFTGNVILGWALFALLILVPRFLYRWAVRDLKAGRVERAARLRFIARFGVTDAEDAKLWQLWTLTGTQQWPAAIEFYEGVETWGALGAAMQARLAVARAYAATGAAETAARSLAFVALSPRTIGALEREYREVRALVPANELLLHAEEQTAEWRKLLNWARPAPVTAGLLAVMLAVFLVDQFLQTPLFTSFGNLPVRAVNGEWYRPVTALFLHAGWLHLVMNGAALWMFGTGIEKALGWGRMLICFLVAGTVANVVSGCVGDFDVSVGASGGVFGLVGAFGVAIYRLRGAIYAGTRRQMLLMLGLMCATDLVIGGLEPQIDNVAHLAGLMTGVLLAILFHD